MSCNPNRQLFNSESPDHTNTRVFCTVNDYITELSATGLSGPLSIPILVGNPQTNEWGPYIINGQTVVLTEQIPSMIVDNDKCYRLDTSQVDGLPGVTITQSWNISKIASSQTGYVSYNSSTCIPVEIVRYENAETPIIYNIGTKNRIIGINPSDIYIDNPCQSIVYPFISRHSGLANVVLNARTSITLTVLSGSVTVDQAQPVSAPNVVVPAGITLSWSIKQDDDRYLNNITFIGNTEDTDFILNGTSNTSSTAG